MSTSIRSQILKLSNKYQDRIEEIKKGSKLSNIKYGVLSPSLIVKRCYNCTALKIFYNLIFRGF